MNGFGTKAEGSPAHAAVGNDWHVEGIGDFDGDGKSDVLWRDDNGAVYIWEMNGLGTKTEGSVAHAAVTNDWHVQEIGDFNDDGNSDILRRNDNGQVYIWEMNGLQIKAEGASRTPQLATIGTFKRDGTIQRTGVTALMLNVTRGL